MNYQSYNNHLIYSDLITNINTFIKKDNQCKIHRKYYQTTAVILSLREHSFYNELLMVEKLELVPRLILLDVTLEIECFITIFFDGIPCLPPFFIYFTILYT
jgi:hypothetical protein